MSDSTAAHQNGALMWLFVAAHTLLPGALLASLAAEEFSTGGTSALLSFAGTLAGGVMALMLLSLPLLATFGLLVFALAPVRH